MDWRNLPSLPALRAFEAAARTGALSKAARELNVTHAAIAQHVRALETHFGLSLLTRQGQGMAPTPEGALLAQGLSDGFTTLADSCRALKDLRTDRPLVITCTPSFAENWLMPRIGGFWSDHPEVALSIRPGNEVVDMRRNGVDLAIRYGRGDWPGLEAEPFLTGDFIICAKPGLTHPARIKTLEDLQRETWLLDCVRAEQQILTRDFGFDMERADVRTFETNGMVLAAARAGLGVAMQSRAVIAADLAQGTLEELLPFDRTDLGYWLVTQPRVQPPDLRNVLRWLRDQV